MSARTDILSRIGAALRDAPAVPTVPRTYRRVSTVDDATRLEQLVDRLVDYKANVVVVPAAELATQLATLLAGTTSIVVPHELDTRWLAALPTGDGGTLTVHTDAPGARLSIDELDACDAVVTAAAVAVAETGTIMLDGSGTQGRRIISLVPDRHICVLAAGDIVELVPEALARLTPTAPQTWISGPSATSDIELERVEGVHGPRVLDVIITT